LTRAGTFNNKRNKNVNFMGKPVVKTPSFTLKPEVKVLLPVEDVVKTSIWKQLMNQSTCEDKAIISKMG
jgi:hypothetical protein